MDIYAHKKCLRDFSLFHVVKVQCLENPERARKVRLFAPLKAQEIVENTSC